MFKDYEKYLSKSLEMYLFVLVIIFILKIVGLDYFGIDINNPTVLRLGNIFNNILLRDVLYFSLVIIYQYLMMSIIHVTKDRKLKIFVILTIPTTYGVQILKNIFVKNNVITILIELSYLYIINFLYYKTNKSNVKFKTFNKRFIITMFLNMLFQFISMLTRYRYEKQYLEDIIPTILLSLDYLLLLIITKKLVVEEGVVKKCISQAEVGSSSLKKINLKKSLQNLQRNFQNSKESFKKKSKEEKLSIIIFIILSSIWNLLTLVIVLLIAKLNDTLVECIFILSSFWLSKRAFGKAFHFDSMILCFIVSNLTYYTLNRITTPLGISIFIPILLGVGLSYVTSKFVKKKYKPLYRGMSKDLFEETILQVVEKDSDKYKICYEFYIDKKSDLSLSYKYNYSVSGIRKIKDRINSKIKRL